MKQENAVSDCKALIRFNAMDAVDSHRKRSSGRKSRDRWFCCSGDEKMGSDFPVNRAKISRQEVRCAEKKRKQWMPSIPTGRGLTVKISNERCRRFLPEEAKSVAFMSANNAVDSYAEEDLDEMQVGSEGVRCRRFTPEEDLDGKAMRNDGNRKSFEGNFEIGVQRTR